MRAAVLAGGAARRYGGRPKGLVELAGRRILDRVVDAVQAATGEPPLLVANAAAGPTWRPDLRTVRDVRPGCGSLGGIYTAIVSAPEPVLCVAWDMPFVTSGLLRALVDGSTGYDAFLPESDNRRGVEPLCAVYGPACAPAIERQLASGDLRAIGFHAAVAVGTLPLERVHALAGEGEGEGEGLGRGGNPATLFFNVNTPEDLERAEAMWRQRG
ncbi:MAG TPA: molybdenum cofactor guanylyltransferase [Gemmatimonadales bacterium]|nr:molybdenum cofactor guanylyltransferase [Gemmatimonadales bacterium]